MARKRTTPKSESRSLRERAESIVRADPSTVQTMPAERVQELVHELSVHQIELEIQNEELRQAQIELADARDQYADLYEFAPVGYLTLSSRGEILQANLTAAGMLRVDRGAAGNQYRQLLDGCVTGRLVPSVPGNTGW